MQDPIEGRIYTRRGGRFYADFRDFAAVGGRQEALKPPGFTRATVDPEEARRLAERRMAELEALRVTPASRRQLPRTLAAYGEHHVRALRTEDRVTEQWLENIGRHLAAAREFFGDGASLAEIDPARVRSYQHALAGRPNGRGGTLGGGSQRQYLATLSALYARAIEEGVPGVVRNPVAQLRHKPRARRREADFLEVWEAALLIRAAETLRRARDDGSETPGLGAIVATYLLTGARSQEVRGLEVGDVSFERRRIFIRNNAHRRLKTLPSARPVPLWPQLESILRAHLEARGWPRTGLLFPRSESEPEAMITDLRRALDAAGARIGMPEGRVRTLLFRHSFCAARLQGVDGAGYPVATEAVSREMGHGGRQMVERIYGHVAGAPHRSDVVEYRLPSPLTDLQRDGRVVVAAEVGLDPVPAAVLPAHVRDDVRSESGARVVLDPEAVAQQDGGNQVADEPLPVLPPGRRCGPGAFAPPQQSPVIGSPSPQDLTSQGGKADRNGDGVGQHADDPRLVLRSFRLRAPFERLHLPLEPLPGRFEAQLLVRITGPVLAVKALGHPVEVLELQPDRLGQERNFVVGRMVCRERAPLGRQPSGIPQDLDEARDRLALLRGASEILGEEVIFHAIPDRPLIRREPDVE